MRFLLTCIFILQLFVLQAQEVISTAGDSFISGNLNVSWTVGEPVIETHTQNLILTQGFHQTNLVVTAIRNALEPDIEIFAYPNPTSDFVTLKTENTNGHSLKYIFTNASGKKLFGENIESETTSISLGKYKSGIYFLCVSENTNHLKTFKIIKNQ